MKPVIVFLALLNIIYGDVLFSPQLPHELAIEKIFPIKDVTGLCNQNKMDMCQNQFNKALSISGDAGWRNYDVLRDDIDKVLQTGVDNGLLKVCRARSEFYGCMNVYYEHCMDRFAFLKRGLSYADAMKFVQLFNELDFICNGGLLQSIQKWDCILQNGVTAEGAERICRDKYLAQTNGTDDRDKMCKAAEDLMLCYRAPFYLSCGEGVAWWSCEQARVALNFDDYCPKLSCSFVTFAPGSNGAQQTAAEEFAEPELKTRSQLFRSVNPGFMPSEKMALYAELGAKASERARKKRSIDDEM